ncbi:MAG: LysM peptidoglycan-binding domain-containing protein [Firmicutes bacterium]|nr:LysM peptidoglycan-binding domain-containing protein [Bacillota bacterium]MBQ7242150.1 LysM peptidoglycan-binding domain-containing protein [Bacillota bacterium]
MFGDENRGRRRGSGGAGLIIALIIFILLTGYFGYHYLLNKTDLLKSQAVVTESADLQAKYDELKLENMALQEEIGVLKGEIVLPEKPAEEAPAEATTETAPAEAPAEAAPTDSQTYTVEKGDTFWKIAQKFYGNGAEFQKILDANGLTENSRINVGDTLIIPN